VTTPIVPPDLAALLDVKAVAALLRCSERHVYRMADAGKMPAPVKLGALVRWPRTGPNGIENLDRRRLSHGEEGGGEMSTAPSTACFPA